MDWKFIGDFIALSGLEKIKPQVSRFYPDSTEGQTATIADTLKS